MTTYVSAYTKDTPYELEAERLRLSLKRFGLAHVIVGYESRGSWEANCAHKATVIREQREALTGKLAWIDADATVEEDPSWLFDGWTADIAVHRVYAGMVCSGTIFIGDTPGARRILERWVAVLERDPSLWDQDALRIAVEELAAERLPLAVAELPAAFCRIVDPFPEHEGIEPIILHHQASRRIPKE